MMSAKGSNNGLMSWIGVAQNPARIPPHRAQIQTGIGAANTLTSRMFAVPIRSGRSAQERVIRTCPIRAYKWYRFSSTSEPCELDSGQILGRTYLQTSGTVSDPLVGTLQNTFPESLLLQYTQSSAEVDTLHINTSNISLKFSDMSRMASR